MEKLDLKGLACPEPVLRVKAALETIAEGEIIAVVDNIAARENVKRYAASAGCHADAIETPPGTWEISIIKGFTCDLPLTAGTGPEPRATAFLMLSEGIGKQPELGKVLMMAFISTLAKADRLPAKMLFLNEAVKLTSEGSDALEDLKTLTERGVEILSCGTCLDFFGKKDKLAVGIVTNMYDTVETLAGGLKVVTIA